MSIINLFAVYALNAQDNKQLLTEDFNIFIYYCPVNII